MSRPFSWTATCAPSTAERQAARMAWAIQAIAALREAQEQRDERCTDAVDRLDEEAFDRLLEAEEAKVEACLLPINAARERDLWPKELYWGGI